MIKWTENDFIIRTTTKNNVCVYFAFHRKLIKVFKSGTIKEKVAKAKQYVGFIMEYYNREGIERLS